MARFVVLAARRPPNPVVAAAGDIACAPTDPNYNGGKGTGTACMQAATGNLLPGVKNLKAVLTLGDNQYDNGALTEYQASYDPTWGQIRAITHPAPGNHEYQTPGASGYFAYYGASAGTGYYSFDIGAWHLISLDSEIDVSAGSPQEEWLKNDLQTHKAFCTLAYWHKARFSSGVNGNYAAYAPLWQDLYAAGADVVINGHDHDYERFAPQNPAQQPDAEGIAEFVVGTGGRNHFPLASSQPNSQVFNSDTFGVLELTLHPTTYDWKFQPVAGSSFTDSGSANCH
jgi:acid phosphatase type 7